MQTSTTNQPFGIVIHADHPEQSVADLSPDHLTEQLLANQLLVLRGFRKLDEPDYIGFCEKFGPLFEWEFGVLLNVRMEQNPANHIFSGGRVELHWDGAFAAKTPKFNIFQCLRSSEAGHGGETTFANTAKLLAEASDEDKQRWAAIELEYSTEKKAHYGGAIHARLVDRHPLTGVPVMRFIEPYNEDNMEVNPVKIAVHGLGEHFDSETAFIDDLLERLYDDKYLYRHQWQTGDFLMVDNHSLLHGRERIRGNVSRHLQRVHVL
ncbi:TauD/TfdA dioxygenase family protein [Chitinimonas lacunae]|uniref:TauD/TfdA dioxygenase family protein n=1 Tax=Chitinimonas lacunae TaxID=1963018 RepID=A0ABV8MSC2_9NEIS